MTALESHKKILIAESDLNRALLIRDGGIIVARLGGVVHEVQKWGSLIGVASLAAGGIAALFRKPAAPAPQARPSKLRRLFGAARFAFELWGVMRPPGKEKSST